MTKFGPSGGRGAAHPGGQDEEHHEGRILFKDNRRIDPKTGAVRQPDAGPDPGVGSPDGPGAAGRVPVMGGHSEAADEVAAARAEVAERTADLQRMTAEYANYRKRVERDRLAAASAAKAAVVAELLRVCDDIERADEHGDLTGGFKTVADKFTGILERQGLSHFGTEGDEFDPNVHEAVQFATSADVDHATVTTVLRRGYLFEERVLRPAVVVVTGPDHDGADGEGESESGAGADADTHGSPADPVVVEDVADADDDGADSAE